MKGMNTGEIQNTKQGKNSNRGLEKRWGLDMLRTLTETCYQRHKNQKNCREAIACN